MLFNSLEFALFFVGVFFVYWFVLGRNYRWQNVFLLMASYFFYSWWDYRFLFLLLFSTLLDYFTGLRMHDARTPAMRKVWFLISIIVNLGFLGFFKYYNFFVESAARALESIGISQVSPWTLSIILPVGISFYTFHGMSYVIDIYKRRIEPTRDFVDYSLFVSFFPLLVAGPIERATHLLPQVQRKRVFNFAQASDGMTQILWGLFKKVVIADNCAKFVNAVFENYSDASGLELVFGSVFFAFQIYGDFSGYSDIALGTAKLMGFDLLVNFRMPYFARDIAEFWRRWHISLTTWFRDYVYIPLGGSRSGGWVAIRNTLIVFLISGFWHGANWTFIFWGLLNALYFIPLLVSGKNRQNLDTVAQGRVFPTMREVVFMGLTFSLTCFAWIFFRSPDLSTAFSYIQGIVTHPFMPKSFALFRPYYIVILGYFLLIEWFIRDRQSFTPDGGLEVTLHYGLSCITFLFIVLFGAFSNAEFIYFQF